MAVVFSSREAYLRCLREGKELPAKLTQEYLQNRDWVHSDETDDAFSFIRVCQALALDPTRVREIFFSDTHKENKLLP